MQIICEKQLSTLFRYIINIYSMHTFVALSCITYLKNFSLCWNVRKLTFFWRKQWRHTAIFVWPRRGATILLALILVHKSHQTTNSSLIVLQYYLKSEIYGTHRTLKCPIPAGWSLDYSWTCFFTLFNFERWSAIYTWSLKLCLIFRAMERYLYVKFKTLFNFSIHHISQ